MSARALRNEVAKMRRLGILLLCGLYLIGVLAMVVFYALSSGLTEVRDAPDGAAWKMLLAALATGATLISPVLLATLASRLVEVEHAGNGWLASATAGLTPGQLCRTKTLALGIPVAVITVMWGVVLMAFGIFIGISAPIPLGRWAALIAALVIVNLAVLAFHVLLSARVENQIVCLGVGVVGIFLAYFGQVLPLGLRHLLPWGYYSLARPADFVSGDRMAYLDVPALSFAALAVLGTALFLLITRHLDRSEA